MRTGEFREISTPLLMPGHYEIDLILIYSIWIDAGIKLLWRLLHLWQEYGQQFRCPLEQLAQCFAIQIRIYCWIISTTDILTMQGQGPSASLNFPTSWKHELLSEGIWYCGHVTACLSEYLAETSNNHATFWHYKGKPQTKSNVRQKPENWFPLGIMWLLENKNPAVVHILIWLMSYLCTLEKPRVMAFGLQARWAGTKKCPICQVPWQ